MATPRPRRARSTAQKRECPLCRLESRRFSCKKCVRETVSAGQSRLRQAEATHAKLEQELAALIDRVRSAKIGDLDDGSAALFAPKSLPRAQKAQNARVRRRVEIARKRLDARKARLRQLQSAFKRQRERLRPARASAAHRSGSPPGSAARGNSPLQSPRSAVQIAIEQQRAELKSLRTQLVTVQRDKVDRLLQCYPVRVKDRDHCTIVGLLLPDNTQFLHQRITPENANRIAMALGYIVFVVCQIAKYLSVPLLHPMSFHGPQSYVVECGRSERKLRLAAREGNELRDALQLLDANIMELCHRSGISEEQLRRYKLLPNMLLLMQSIELRITLRRTSPIHTLDMKRVEQTPPVSPKNAKGTMSASAAKAVLATVSQTRSLIHKFAVGALRVAGLTASNGSLSSTPQKDAKDAKVHAFDTKVSPQTSALGADDTQLTFEEETPQIQETDDDFCLVDLVTDKPAEEAS